MKDTKGVRYLAELLSHPGVERHAADLQIGEDSAGAVVPRGATAGLSVRRAGAEDAGPVLDETAKSAYRQRVEDLREEIEEAELFNDPERAARARGEMEQLGQELSAAVGLGGRDRRAASSAERARVNVTRALRKAVERIAELDAELGEHLRRSVRTGVFCVYDPGGSQAVKVEIERAGSR
jgi:non-specific serine/threonine protein kinase